MAIRSLKILLDKTWRHYYSPGEEITGRVVFESDQSDEIPDVVITFDGHSNTHISRRVKRVIHTYHEAKLFEESKVLFKGPRGMPPGKHAWPFAFVFPERSELKCDGFEEFNDPTRDPFFSGPQALPPTMEASNADHECAIRYKLHAKLKLNRTLISLNDDRFLLFAPLRAGLRPDPVLVTLPQSNSALSIKYKVEAGGAHASLSTKESMKSLFKKAASETLAVRVDIRTPTVLVLGQPLSLAVALHRTTDSPTAQLPALLITSIDAAVRIDTTIRANSTSEWTDEITDRKPLGSTPAIGELVAYGTLVELQPTPSCMLPLEAGPGTIRSYNIHRDFKLDIDVNVQCLGKMYVAKFKDIKVIVLPAGWRADAKA